MKTTDRLQEVQRQYEAMERAVKQMRAAADEAGSGYRRLKDLLASEAAQRERMLWNLRYQKLYLFVMAVVGGFAGATLDQLAGRFVNVIWDLF